MTEDHDVTGIGDHWGSTLHRSLSISRCENGYVIKYQAVVKKPEDPMLRDDYSPPTVSKTRVFTNNPDMVEFVEEYFVGSPRP